MTNPPAVREAGADDVEAILACAGAALGWRPDDPNEQLFRWKHLENPAGASAMWVATEGPQVVGFRAMLRWDFERDGNAFAAVRAVDTATHPDHQRRGIFRNLTLAAVEALTAAGVSFVFNTPNDNSRPGYLRMGWTDQGRIAARVHLSGAGSITRVAGARTAAEKWSEPASLGDPIDDVADDLAGATGALDPALRTCRDAVHLRWRYGFEPLHYRVIQTDGAAAILRVRHRGAATEAVVADIFASDRRSASRVISAASRLPGVDYALRLESGPDPARGGLRLPGLGPRFTTRALSEPAPSRADFRLSLGDIELF